MFTVECHVGRLVEIRFSDPVTIEEMNRFRHEVARVVAGRPSVVACTTLIGVKFIDRSVADRFVEIVKTSPYTERNAILCSDRATLGFQVERIIQRSGKVNRRAFYWPGELAAWLGEVLTPHEQNRLDDFLREIGVDHMTHADTDEVNQLKKNIANAVSTSAVGAQQIFAAGKVMSAAARNLSEATKECRRISQTSMAAVQPPSRRVSTPPMK